MHVLALPFTKMSAKQQCQGRSETKSQHEATHEHHAFNVKLSSLSAETVADRKKIRSD